MQHLDEGTIHAWLDGALSAEQAADVERHAGECAECAALVADARGMIAGAARIISALDDVPAGVIPARRAPTTTGSLWRTLRLTPFRAALAASLMIAAASLAVVRSAPQNRVKDLATPMAAPAAAPAVAVAADTAKLEMVAKQSTTAKVAPERRVAQAPVSAAAPPAPVADQQRSAAAESERKPMVVAIDSTRRRADVVATSQLAAANAVRPSAAGGTAGGADARRDVGLRSEPALSIVAISADDRPLQVPGCFQLVRDSAGRSFAFPERFSLESAADSGVPRNIMRAVALDGRRDSLIAGVTWRFAPGASRVVLIGSEPSPAPVSSFKAKSTDATGRVAGLAGYTYTNMARLTRINCR